MEAASPPSSPDFPPLEEPIDPTIIEDEYYATFSTPPPAEEEEEAVLSPQSSPLPLDLQELVAKEPYSRYPSIKNAVRTLASANPPITKADQFLKSSKVEVSRLVKLNPEEYSMLQACACLPFVRNPYTCLNLLEIQKLRLSVGCPILDKFFHGGLLKGAITEFVGEAGAGKSQLCMQLLLSVQLPREKGGLQGGAVIIHTEGAFPSRRLQQLAECFKKDHPEMAPFDLLQAVFVEKLSSAAEVDQYLSYKLPALLGQYNIQLLVIDSVAALRFDFGTGLSVKDDSIQKANWLGKLALKLKDLASGSDMVVVVTNHVTDKIEEEKVQLESGKKLPALGLSWANSLNCRFFLRKTLIPYERQVQSLPSSHKRKLDALTDSAEVTILRRTISCLFAPHIPESSESFVVESRGVRGIAEYM